jgi:hypothetical protein
MKVIGIGEKKTPSPFIASCNKFIYIEILHKKSKPSEQIKDTNKLNPKNKVKKDLPLASVSKIDQEIIQLILESINDIAEEDDWVFLGVLGNLILKKQPDFDPRNYGHKKLLDMIQTIPDLEIDKRPTGKIIFLIFMLESNLKYSKMRFEKI